MVALQYASKMFVTNIFEVANLATIHAHRSTLTVPDMQLVYAVHSMAEGSAFHDLKSNLVSHPNPRDRWIKGDKGGHTKVGHLFQFCCDTSNVQMSSCR